VSTSAATPVGTHPLTITGTSGPITRSTTVTLSVAGSFSLSVSPPSRTVPRNGTRRTRSRWFQGPGSRVP
jgi:hypothetical protein